jgi:hypothetical protein
MRELSALIAWLCGRSDRGGSREPKGECPLRVIDGLVIGGQRQPLSVVSPIALLAVQCSEGRNVPIGDITLSFKSTKTD